MVAPSRPAVSSETTARPQMKLRVVLAIVAAIGLACLLYVPQPQLSSGAHLSSHLKGSNTPGEIAVSMLPDQLFTEGMYRREDFINSEGISPPFWNCSSTGTCKSKNVWGPCYAPQGRIDWKNEAALAKDWRRRFWHPQGPSWLWSMSNYCRPGFLIIGAAKSGTSSLYHYLVDHPRVMPAMRKQIHYFKYAHFMPLKFYYYSFFPNAKAFLASGALLTGEASPGYLPYPNVPYRVKKTLPGPRIIALGRKPIDRSYSAYNFDYVTPALEQMARGGVRGIAGGKDLDSYRQYVFSFEELIAAELPRLRECLAPNGPGISGARKKWGRMAKEQYKSRDEKGLPDLVDLDGFCYGDRVNATVSRPQWAELQTMYPRKVIPDRKAFLAQSLIGRSLYTLPLEWWYGAFDHTEITFLCTEELSDMSGSPLNDLGGWLGLPFYNFSKIVRKGAYNVAGSYGYNNKISWDAVEHSSKKAKESKDIPLSADLLREFEDFVRPYNERLFKLTGKRCDW